MKKSDIFNAILAVCLLLFMASIRPTEAAEPVSYGNEELRELRTELNQLNEQIIVSAGTGMGSLVWEREWLDFSRETREAEYHATIKVFGPMDGQSVHGVMEFAQMHMNQVCGHPELRRIVTGSPVVDVLVMNMTFFFNGSHPFRLINDCELGNSI